MAKWCDYIITAIKHNNGHISHVWICRDQGEDDMAIGSMMTKNYMINLLKAGSVVYTAKWAYNAPKWKIGARVSYETQNGIEYLRTHPDETTTDNLENMIDLRSFGL